MGWCEKNNVNSLFCNFFGPSKLFEIEQFAYKILNCFFKCQPKKNKDKLLPVKMRKKMKLVCKKVSKTTRPHVYTLHNDFG